MHRRARPRSGHVATPVPAQLVRFFFAVRLWGLRLVNWSGSGLVTFSWHGVGDSVGLLPSGLKACACFLIADIHHRTLLDSTSSCEFTAPCAVKQKVKGMA